MDNSNSFQTVSAYEQRNRAAYFRAYKALEMRREAKRQERLEASRLQNEAIPKNGHWLANSNNPKPAVRPGTRL